MMLRRILMCPRPCTFRGVRRGYKQQKPMWMVWSNCRMRIHRQLSRCLIPNKMVRSLIIVLGAVANHLRLLHGWGELFTHMMSIPKEWWIYPHAQSAQMHKFPHGRKISSHQNMVLCSVMRPVLDRAVGGAIQKENGH